MKYSKLLSIALVAALISGVPKVTLAGPYADDMAKCLVTSASPQDRTLLVQWIFSVMALHPAIASMTTISSQQRDQLTRGAGALFQRLLLKSCRSQTQQAVQNEGPQTIAYAFQILGQVAMRGLMTDEHVTEGMKALGNTMDEARLKSLISRAPQ